MQLQAAEVRFVPDGGVRATQALTGEAHISRVIPVSALEKMKAAAGVNVMSIETTRTNGLYLNHGRAPFDDVNARRAVQSAIDAAAIAGSNHEGSARPAMGPFAPNEPSCPAGAAWTPAFAGGPGDHRAACFFPGTQPPR